MATVVITIDGKEIAFEIENVNGILFRDKFSRARFDENIYLSLVVTSPKLSATEWHEKVPILYKTKILEAIENFLYGDDNNV